MAVIVSTQAGNWGTGATWVGGVAPGAGDQAQIAHAVTVDANKTVGTYGAAGTYAVRIDTGGSLDLAAGVVLTSRGDIASNAANRTITMAAGSQIIFDSSGAAGTPVYETRDGAGGLKLVCNGSSVSRCRIDKAASSGNWFFNRNANSDTAITATYTDFVNLGNGTRTFDVAPASGAGRGLSLDHCTVDTYSGRFDINGTADANYNWNVSFKNGGASQYSVRLNVASAATGTRIFRFCVFDKEFLSDQNSHGLDIQDCQFYALVTLTGGTLLANWKRNFINHTGTVLVNSNLPGTYYDSYLPGNKTNPHYYAFYNPDAAGTFVCDGNVYENLTNDENGDCVLADATAFTHAVTMRAVRDLVIPNAGGQNTSGSPITVARNATNLTVSLENCTYPIGGAAGTESLGAVLFEDGASDSYGNTALVEYMRSNLAWDHMPGRSYKARALHSYAVNRTATSGGASTLTDSTQAWGTNVFTNYKVKIIGGTGSGQVRTISSNTGTQLSVSSAWTTNPDNTSQYRIFIVDMFQQAPNYNGGWNFLQGDFKDENYNDVGGGTNANGYNSYCVTGGTAYGANDVSGNPLFVDPTRNLARWDYSLGGPGTAANAITELQKLNDASGYNPNYNVADLVKWVRYGFVPRNTAYRGSGYNGADIGALPSTTTTPGKKIGYSNFPKPLHRSAA